MNSAMKKLTIGCASAMVLLGATTLSANAFYTGYANGDPGNWDFWEEQQGGPRPEATAPVATPKHAVLEGHSCSYLHHRAIETGKASWWHRYHACMNG